MVSKVQEAEHEQEVRFTFSAQFTEIGRIKTKIQEKAFEFRVPCSFESLGGLKERTVGVKIVSTNAARRQKFINWYQENISDVIAPRSHLGLLIKEYI